MVNWAKEKYCLIVQPQHSDIGRRRRSRCRVVVYVHDPSERR